MATKQRVLFIGGPQHGKVMETALCLHIQVPVYRRGGFEYGETSTRCFKEFTYTRRQVRIGTTFATVWAPEAYTEAQVDRAIADYLEGVSRTMGDY